MRAAVLGLILLLTACNRTPTAAEISRNAPRAPTPSGQAYSTVGTVVSVVGGQVTLDHEAAPGGQAAGRNSYRAYADVLAEAPLTPGARVSFTYQMAGSEPILTAMTARQEP